MKVFFLVRALVSEGSKKSFSATAKRLKSGLFVI
jgi:hypothetical protein